MMDEMSDVAVQETILADKSEVLQSAKEGEEIDEEEQQQVGNKGWLSNLHRESRVGEHEFQAQIPSMLFNNVDHQNRLLTNYRAQRQPYLTELQVYKQPKSFTESEMKEYLSFACSISLKDNKNDSDGLLSGLPSTNQVEANALNFLAKCDYSIIRAKFFMVFPTLMFYNAYKANKANPVQLSDAEMKAKVDSFVSQLQETKLGQHEKWRQELTEMMENRNHVAKIHQHLENGKLMRYEVPDNIKDAFDRAHKFSKELKKIMAERAQLEKLETMLETANNDHKIITNEMVQFEQGIVRCREWLNRVEPLYTERDRISLKVLTALITEYKSLPLKCVKFEDRFKSVYEASLELIEKIPNFARISKTRGMQVQEPIKIEAAIQILAQIQKLNVYCDEFDSFEYALIFNLEKINNLMMFLNDHRATVNLEVLKQLKNETQELSFWSKVSEQISDLYDYLKIIEKVKKQMHDAGKLQTLLEEITKAEERGFKSIEMEALKKQIAASIQWFENLEKLVIEKKPLSEKKLFSTFKLDTNEYMKINTLEQMQEDSEILSIDATSLQEFNEICAQIQQWKDSWNAIKDVANSSKDDSKSTDGEKMAIEGEEEPVEAAIATTTTTIESFDSFLKFIQKGLTFGIASAELLESIEYYRRGVTWTLTCLAFVNEYRDTPLSSDLFSDSLVNQFNEILSKSKSTEFEYIKSKANHEKLILLLDYQRIPGFCRQSKQYQALLKIKQYNQINSKIDCVLQMYNLFFDVNDRDDVAESEREVQKILDLQLEEVQELDHFDVVYLIPKLAEKQKSLPIDNSNIQKLQKLFVLQKWGKEAVSAIQFIKEESSEGRRLQELLKKQGIVEFSTEVDSLAQKLLPSDLETFIFDCQQFWAKFSLQFSDLLETIQRNPLRDVQEYSDESKDNTQWDYKQLQTLLKNGEILDLKNAFLKLHNEIRQFTDQTDSWINSFYSKTFLKRTIVTKDGRKTIKKSGLKIDELKTLIVSDDFSNKTGEQQSLSVAVNEKQNESAMVIEESKEKSVDDESMKEEETQTGIAAQVKDVRSKEEQQKIARESAEERKKMKQSKMNTLNYYLGQPMIMMTFFEGLSRNIHNQEMLMAQSKLSELFKYKTKAAELLRTKQSPTLEEMKSYLTRGEQLNCYMPEQSVMKKISKWAHDWLEIARKVLESISKNKKYLNNTKVKAKAILPTDFSEELYLIAFDPVTCTLNIKRKPAQTVKHAYHSAKSDKGFFEGDLESQIKYLIKTSSPKKTVSQQQQQQQQNLQNEKQQSRKSSAQLSGSSNATATTAAVVSSKRNIVNKYIKSSASYRPKRATSIPKHYLEGQFLYDNSLKFSALELAQQNAGIAPVAPTGVKSTPVKATPKRNGSGGVQIVEAVENVDNKKRRYTARKPSPNEDSFDNGPIKKKRIVFKDRGAREEVSIEEIQTPDKPRRRASSNARTHQQQQQYHLAHEIAETTTISLLNNNNSSQVQIIEEDENKAYCICRGYSGEESIGCDGCQDWFHFSCNGLKPQLGNQIKKFYCMACCSRYYRPYLSGHKTDFIWDAIEKISLEQFNEIVKEGLLLPLQMKEIDEILELKIKVDEQLQEMNTLIQRGADVLQIIELYEKAYKLEREDEVEMARVKELHVQEKEKDQQLFQCYLAHFGFPVEFAQSDELLVIIQRRDFARQLSRHYYSNRLVLLEQFFTQVEKLFDLPKVLGNEDSEHIRFVYNHVKKIYENSVVVNQQIDEISKQKVSAEVYSNIIARVNSENLIVENMHECSRRLEEYKKWQADVQTVLTGYQQQQQSGIPWKSNSINAVDRFIDTFEKRIMCLSPLYDMLKGLREEIIQGLNAMAKEGGAATGNPVAVSIQSVDDEQEEDDDDDDEEEESSGGGDDDEGSRENDDEDEEEGEGDEEEEDGSGIDEEEDRSGGRRRRGGGGSDADRLDEEDDRFVQNNQYSHSVEIGSTKRQIASAFNGKYSGDLVGLNAADDEGYVVGEFPGVNYQDDHGIMDIDDAAGQMLNTSAVVAGGTDETGQEGYFYAVDGQNSAMFNGQSHSE